MTVLLLAACEEEPVLTLPPSFSDDGGQDVGDGDAGVLDAGVIEDAGAPVDAGDLDDAGVASPDAGFLDCQFEDEPASIAFACEGDEDWCDEAGDVLHPESDILATWSRFDGTDWILDVRFAAPPFRNSWRESFYVAFSTTRMKFWPETPEYCTAPSWGTECVAVPYPTSVGLGSMRAPAPGYPPWLTFAYPPVPFFVDGCDTQPVDVPLTCDACMFDDECSSCLAQDYPACPEASAPFDPLSFDQCSAFSLGQESPVLEIRLPFEFVGNEAEFSYVVVAGTSYRYPDGSQVFADDSTFVDNGVPLVPQGGAPDDVTDLVSVCAIGCPNEEQ